MSARDFHIVIGSFVLLGILVGMLWVEKEPKLVGIGYFRKYF